MTKKIKRSKTLKAAVLATIMAMAFSTTAWAGMINTDSPKVTNEYKNYETDGHGGEVPPGYEGNNNYADSFWTDNVADYANSIPQEFWSYPVIVEDVGTRYVQPSTNWDGAYKPNDVNNKYGLNGTYSEDKYIWNSKSALNVGNDGIDKNITDNIRCFTSDGAGTQSALEGVYMPVVCQHLAYDGVYSGNAGEAGAIYKFVVKDSPGGDSVYYGTVIERENEKHMVINLDVRSKDTILTTAGETEDQNVYTELPKATPPSDFSDQYARMMQIYNMDYAATLVAMESEQRAIAEVKLTMDDVKRIGLSINETTGEITSGIMFESGEAISVRDTLVPTIENFAAGGIYSSQEDYYEENTIGWAINNNTTQINNAYTEAKKHTTVEASNNITVIETENNFGGKHYVISTASEVEFTKVTVGNTTIDSNTGINTNSITTQTIQLGDSAITYNTENDRIQYVDGSDTYNIAHLGDGFTFETDDGTITKTLNQTLNINGGDNITTKVEDGVINVHLNKELTNLTSVTATTINGNDVNVTNTLKIGDATTNVTVTNNNINMNNGTITEVSNLETKNIKLGDNISTNITYATTSNGDRITYVENINDQNVTQEVANLNDGKHYLGDGTTTTDLISIKDDVTIKGGAATDNLSLNNIGVVAEGRTLNVKLSKDVTGLNSVTSETVNVNQTLNVGEDVTIDNDGMIINGGEENNSIIINKTEVNVGGNTINNVAAGEISATSTDAINGSQLYETNQRLDKLGGRVDKVGAGAAALAALHPLDFDPDDKLSFSAGVGNYGGETATALGAFYRPTEKVMLSAAGTMGNGENMVNMGVTFALDRKNNVSNSRTAMAREILELREHAAKQDKQIAQLTALINQLVGKEKAVVNAVMFPDVPENHWAYDYIESLQKRGIIEGYPDGNFAGDRSMTRYEYAAMLWRALEQGFPVDSRLLDEFDVELGRIRVDRIKGEDNDANKTERVRVNDYEDRDDYGSKIISVGAN